MTYQPRSPVRRRYLTMSAIALSGALVLGACSADSDDSSSATASESASASSADPSASTSTDTTTAEIAGDQVGFTAEGEFGENPTIAFGSETPPEGLQVQTLIEGDGAEIASGDYVVANYVGEVWGSDTAFDNSFERETGTMFSLNGVIEGWATGLVGQTVGSRVLLSIPAELGYGPQGGNEGAGIGAEDTIVFVVDIYGAYNNESMAQADAEPTDADIPVEITGGIGEAITDVQVDDGAAEPTETTLTVIATGTGEEITTGAEVVVQYALNDWANSAFETSYGPDGLGPSNTVSVVEGFPFAGLDGVPLGSRVLVTMPATEETDTAAGAPAYAFVVDLLGTLPSNVS